MVTKLILLFRKIQKRFKDPLFGSIKVKRESMSKKTGGNKYSNRETIEQRWK